MPSLFPPLPVFLDLVGRSVVICAGDLRAARFAAECLEAGAGVSVVHPAPCAETLALSPRVRLVQRRWRAADFKNATLVVTGVDERRISQARASAKTAKAMFLALDGAAQSDLALGETTARGPLTIGMSAVGLPPGLVAALRARFDAAAPAELTPLLEAAARAGDGAFGQAGASAAAWADVLAAALRARPHDWDVWLANQFKSRLSAAQ